MPWVKIDDNFASHPKVIAAGPAAGWLYVCGLTYAARYLTDGFIPERQVRMLADVDNPDTIAARLVEVGLWERVGGGYMIHDYLKYNPSSEQVRRDREEAAKRQAEWRERNSKPAPEQPAKQTESNEDSNAVSNDVTNPATNTHPVPVPVPQPVPDPGPAAATPAPAKIGAAAAVFRSLEEFGELAPYENCASCLKDVVKHVRELCGLSEQTALQIALDYGPWRAALNCVDVECAVAEDRRNSGSPRVKSPSGLFITKMRAGDTPRPPDYSWMWNHACQKCEEDCQPMKAEA